MVKKDLSNPFKLRWTWVGFVIGFIPLIYIVLIFLTTKSFNSDFLSLFFYLNVVSLIISYLFCNDYLCAVGYGIILSPFVFFLYGWIVEFLIKKYGGKRK